jgi:DNA-binding NarL/FixJ family response regulator
VDEAGTTRRVLIAEDQQGMRNLVRWLVELEDGLEVVGEATSGQEVIDQAHSLRPDAIVLDLGLPEVDGEVALAELRSELPETKIVVLSGQASALIQPRLRELGADAVVEKDSASPQWQAQLLAELHGARVVAV